MADVELDDSIVQKLVESFHVDREAVSCFLKFFNGSLKPAIRQHYLSHLVSSVEELINGSIKEKLLENIKDGSENLKLVNIILCPVLSNKKKAKLKITRGGNYIICYSKFIGENEKRFAIAHELGHIVSIALLDCPNASDEDKASLFAYIALLDKNNFYKHECQDYISDTDLKLFNNYKAVMHI